MITCTVSAIKYNRILFNIRKLCLQTMKLDIIGTVTNDIDDVIDK